MKLHYGAPTTELVIVKHDPDTPDYEFWVLVPVCLGSAQKIAHQRIEVDGHHFTNLPSAGKYLLEKAGAVELAAGQKLRVKTAKPKIMPTVTMTGMDLLEKDLWKKFCSLRKINFKSMPDLAKSYQLTKKELEQLEG